MSRSHPPSLLALARRTVEDHALFGRGDVVLVAVSGGPDSMALLHVLAQLRAKMGHALIAHGVDHGLRPGASLELDLAERVASSLGVRMSRSSLRVAPGSNLQARARDARFEALRAAAARERASVIATGHHADDRAETVLLRLLRGAGPRGLAVLPARSGDLVRPLLSARRSDVEAHLRRHGVPHALDPSNADPRFLRVRVRNELLPLLEELSPGIVGHLTALADQLGAGTGSAGSDATHIPLPLPRRSRDALAALARTRSPRARVRLPKGLVARYDRAQLSIVVGAEENGDLPRGHKVGRGTS